MNSEDRAETARTKSRSEDWSLHAVGMAAEAFRRTVCGRVRM